ncbi:MAG: hypothetical protein RIQ97_2430 [Pseudomonadota bacterium]
MRQRQSVQHRQLQTQRPQKRGAGLLRTPALFCSFGLALCLANPALSNGFGESGTWQFQSSQEKVNRATLLDMIEKKKAGYYDSFRSTYNYNTYIDRQVNCTMTAANTANAGTNSTTAATSSPTLTSSGTTSSNVAANSGSSGLSQAGLNGVLTPSQTNSVPTGSLSNTQSNSGALNSGVSGSSTTSSTGAVTAGGGATDQVLNSDQNNSGSLSASISGSTACSGTLN